MRTAIILAKPHGGNWRLLSTPDAPIVEQRQQIRELRGRQTHPEFSEVRFQDSDGDMIVLRFSPEAKPVAKNKK